LNDLTALFEEDIQQWKRQTFGDAEDLPVPCDPVFKSHNMFSRAEILGASPFGKIEGKVETSNKSTNKLEKQEERCELTTSRAALPRALNLVSVLVANNCVKIRSGKDGNLSEYSLAKGFHFDKKHFRRGWGRRPLAGKLYGESHISEFHQEIYDWVAAGSRDKSEKKNPRQMYLMLRRKYARYSVPMESEIRVHIDSILKSLEAEKTKKPQKKKETKEKKEKILERLEGKYETVSCEMKKKVRQKGWQDTKPMSVFNRIVFEKELIGNVSGTKPKAVAGLNQNDIKVLSNECRKEFSSWKSSRKKKRENLIKKSLI
jgi:hypothetical protein